MKTLSLAAAALALATLAAPLRAQTLVVRGETVHTLAGAPIRNGVVVVEKGKIVAVGPAETVAVPAGAKVLSAKVVVPGLVDARSVVGLAGYLNQPHDQQQVDGGSPIQPELRAGDAYDPSERLIEWVRGFGVTTLHTGHAPAALVSGQTMIVKTIGKGIDDAVVVPEAAISVSLGSAGTVGTRARTIALLRTELQRAKEALASADKEGSAKGARDLRKEAWMRVLRKQTPLLVNANKALDIDAALRLQREFGFRMWLEGGSEAPLLASALKKANVPVILHPTMARPGGDSESLSMESAAALRQAGVMVALQSGYETYVPKTRVVLFEAAMAAANGLEFEDALATITRDAARILGIDKRVGTLEVGKEGDLALYDGDPFEYATHCVGTVIAGTVVFEGSR